MDEDIDIEEHDVLDNPKIRDIFPDLSLVKIEPPDINIQACQYEVPAELKSHDDELRPNIKREIISDDENDITSRHGIESDHNYVQRPNVSCVFEQSEQNGYRHKQNDTVCNYEQSGTTYEDEQNDTSCNYEENEQDYEQSNVVENQQRNRIILGRKPVLDYDKLYEEALHSKAIVYLEDWGQKLKRSPCYCQRCEILYPTVNCLDAHKGVSHSLLVALDTSRIQSSPTRNVAKKSTVTSTYCNHCDKTFPSDTDLIKHLYKLLPIGNYEIPTPTPVKVEAKCIQYKCIKCKLYFATFLDGKKHKTTCHPHLKNSNIICKVQRVKDPQDEERIKKSLIKKPQYGKLLANSSLVPKNVLFQCNICLIGFLSCYSALQHSRKCEKKADFKKCDICKRKIRYNDIKAHELQHQHSDKLKIYTLNDKIYEKVIVKCPKCNICFEEKGFWCHWKICNGKKVENVRCEICGIDIKESRYPSHKLKHSIKKYTRKDFIVIEFYDTIETSSKIENKVTKLNLYYCDLCGSYKTIKSLKGHDNGACQNLGIKFCDICGLGFGRMHYKIHRATHDHLESTGIKDYEIISLYSNKKIEPPMPDFHQCNDCNIRFLSKQNATNHSCVNEKYMTCKICNEKFNLKAFTPHSKFHDFKEQYFNDDIPELLKMYNSINNMWDIVYMCLNCSIITVTYDSAVEHSQNHIYGEENSVYKTCDICLFDIIEKDYSMHVKLHENNANISRKQFRILKFNYRDMYKKKWMNIFLPLPLKDKHQILAKSIYRCTRRFKLNCEINCRSDDTKFYCKKCKTSVSIEVMKKHYFDGQCKYVSKYVCKTCNMNFTTLCELVIHENEHENLNKTYKVYSFNDKNDKEFNEKLLDFDCNKIINSKTMPHAMTPKSVIKRIVRKQDKVMGSKIKKTYNKMAGIKNKFKLYKCRKCEACVIIDKNVQIHKCTTLKKGICRICNNAFYSRNLDRHIEMHKFYGKKPVIVYFDPPADSSESKVDSKAIIYKCDCGLHFTSKQSIENHLSVCSDDLDISKETCSKCHRLFPTDVLVTHLCKHHSKAVKVEIVEVPKNSNFKCGYCNIIFSNMNNFDKHVFYCPLKNGKNCKQCLFSFDRATFTKHTCDTNQAMIVVKKSVISSILYKCNECELYYLNRKSISYHYEQGHNTQRKSFVCDVCGLRFTDQGIAKHMLMHQSGKKQYMIKVIDGTEYYIIKGANRKTDFKTNKISSDDESNSSNKVKKVENKINENDSELNSSKKVKNDQDVTDDKSVVSSSLYRCNSCDLCYHFKKTWDYHIDMKHVTKRPVANCEICGLKFTKNSLINHAGIHDTDDDYIITIHEMDTGEITVIKGKNGPVHAKKQDNKRPAEFDESHLEKKSKKCDAYLSDNDDRQNASTSRIDFESVTMADDEITTVISDFGKASGGDVKNVTDPLVDSSEMIVLDDSDNNISDANNTENILHASDVVLSKKLKDILSSKLENYNNFIYECMACGICFLTKMACISHFKRTDHSRTRLPTCLKCDDCGFKFTLLTLARHKYIHHDELKLTSKTLSVIKVSEEYNTSKKIAWLLSQNHTTDENTQEVIVNNNTNEVNMDVYENTPKDSTETESHDVMADANTDEVNMDLDENIRNDIKRHYCNKQNNTTQAENTNEIYNNSNEMNPNTVDVDNVPKIHYFKCADCNVCFIDEDLCRKHCVSHNRLDPRMYIECKLCNFQFSLDSLMNHVTLHHDTEFCLENLMITEYTPGTDRNLKIDTYRGIDKVQSRLVSTTTDLPIDNAKSIIPVTVESNR